MKDKSYQVKRIKKKLISLFNPQYVKLERTKYYKSNYLLCEVGFSMCRPYLFANQIIELSNFFKTDKIKISTGRTRSYPSFDTYKFLINFAEEYPL